jgi:mannose-6-phosphate isomerase
VFPLRNPVQRYDWGSPDALPRLLGTEPDGTPQAELWLGAHPAAPSLVEIDGRPAGLEGLIAADPAGMLGGAVLARFGPTLPFLFKVLAAAQPLSLQVHPGERQAREGYARDEAAGLAPDDPRRTYRDAHHKPELLCALERFEVLSGFRPAAQIAEQFEAFDLPAGWVALARAGDPGRLCAALWALDDDGRHQLLAAVSAAARSGSPADARFGAEAGFVRRATDRFPGDIGALVGLCLNRLQLSAGQGVFAAAGRLHSYLEGVGVELMANSDNVVRAGLTTKAIDVDELLRLLDTTADIPAALEPLIDEVTGEARFPVQVDEFCLSSFRLDGERIEVDSPGPEILLCVDGAAEVDQPGPGWALPRGASLFVPASTARYRLHGRGAVYRAAVGLLHRTEQEAAGRPGPPGP